MQLVNNDVLQLFEAAWLDSTSNVEDICNLFNEKFEKLDKLEERTFDKIWKLIKEKTMSYYLTAMMKRKISSSTPEEQQRIADQIRTESSIFKEFFSAVAKNENEADFDNVLELIANIISTDEEMLTFELMTFLRYSNSAEWHGLIQ